jgi:hypothetical protein
MTLEKTIETPAEAFSRAIAAAENDLDHCLDAMGRPDLKDELKEFLRGLSEGVKEVEAHGA